MAPDTRKHSEVRQRTEAVLVRLLPAERELLKAEAERTGQHESTLLRERFLASLKPGEATAYQELLASVWLYIKWEYVTRQLTTEQKDLFADAIDASHARANAEDPELGAIPVDRWWRE